MGYAPDAVIGVIGVPAAAAPAGGGAVAPAVSKGSKSRDYSKSESNRKNRMKGEGKIKGCIGALAYMVLGFMKEIVFIIIHAVGNLHVFLGPNDFNGYGYFYVRLYWT